MSPRWLWRPAEQARHVHPEDVRPQDFSYDLHHVRAHGECVTAFFGPLPTCHHRSHGRCRAAMGLGESQRRLAEEMACDKRTVGRWINGAIRQASLGIASFMAQLCLETDPSVVVDTEQGAGPVPGQLQPEARRSVGSLLGWWSTLKEVWTGQTNSREIGTISAMRLFGSNPVIGTPLRRAR